MLCLIGRTFYKALYNVNGGCENNDKYEFKISKKNV